MREIDRQIMYAVEHREWFSKGNTVVDWDKGEIKVTLHGNVIVKSEEGMLVINDCGYATQTTAARINAVLSGLHLPLSYSYGKGGYFTDSDGQAIDCGHIVINLETRVISQK